MAKVLILGAGLVAAPLVRFLLEKNIALSIASNTPENANDILKGHPLGQSLFWMADDDEVLKKLVEAHDVVVSLLPFVYHPKVARICLEFRKDMVTTSYTSDEMRSLHQYAKQSGLVILNEMGLDPGIDHMSAKKIIDTVHHKGGKIIDFYSFCGALAAPEALNNPFKYRFSWSPRGVIMAARNGAQYKFDNNIIKVPENDLFKDVRNIDFPNIGKMEVYPNRDSLSYMTLYGINEAETIIRGTIRYPDWCEIWDVIKNLGLLDLKEINTKGMNYATLTNILCGKDKESNPKESLMSFIGVAKETNVVSAFEWLGLLSDKLISGDQHTPFDLLADLMIPRMLLGNDERDMVLMLHIFKVCYPDGKKEVIRSLMTDYGIKGGDTSVARTVSLPAAVSVLMLLNKQIKEKGVLIPVLPEIYNPVLNELMKMGINLEEEYGLEDIGVKKISTQL